VHVVVAGRWASEPARLTKHRAIAGTFVRRVYREELYEVARAALFGLGSPVAGGAAPLRR
jgi:hypothetical protein